jgi:hypothetical protein
MGQGWVECCARGAARSGVAKVEEMALRLPAWMRSISGADQVLAPGLRWHWTTPTRRSTARGGAGSSRFLGFELHTEALIIAVSSCCLVKGALARCDELTVAQRGDSLNVTDLLQDWRCLMSVDSHDGTPDASLDAEAPAPSNAQHLSSHRSAEALHLYAAVAARRTQFDNLMWQVPILSITAQAFLFTVSLAADTSQASRIIAASLSLITTVLTLQLFVRHRQSEITDAHWLEDRELTVLGESFHGRTWQASRNATDPSARPFSSLAALGGYRTWSIGLLLFGLASLVILVLAVGWPQLLHGAK